MTTTALFHQIESLPDDLRQEVADFVAFLKFKRLGIRTADDFTQEECDEFERRWAEYGADPSTGTDAFEAMKNIREIQGIGSVQLGDKLATIPNLRDFAYSI